MIKQIVVLLCIFNISFCSAEAEAAAKADSDPGYGHYYGHGRHGGDGYGHYAPRCHLTYDVVTSKECHAVPETVCHTEHVTNYVTKPEEQCTTQYHTVVDTTYVEECQDIVTQHCTHTHVTTQAHSTVVDHVVGAPVNPHVVAHHDVHAPALALAPPHPHPHPVAKREADADAEAEAEADADAQLFHAAAPHVAPPAPVAHHQHPPQCQDQSLSKCAMTSQSLSVSRCLCRSLSRYLCRSVVRYQGKCASQYTRRFQGSTVPLDMVVIEDTGGEAIFINLYYCYKLNTK